MPPFDPNVSELTMKFSFVASNSDKSKQAYKDLVEKYGQHDAKDADVIVALGGDGFLLHTMRERMDHNKPIYGMNGGTLGFLMNPLEIDDLEKRVTYAQSVRLFPLKMEATHTDGSKSEALAFNEVALNRQTPQAAKIRIDVDGQEQMNQALAGDGILLATAMGSTAYNYSAHGPILPIGANLLALTPICPSSPRQWRGALLANTSEVTLTIQESEKRPVSASADVIEFRDVAEVKIYESREHSCTLLYEPDHHLSSKIMRAQFAP
jgi:NAD+ kinase